MAEIEIGVMSRQCLRGYLSDIDSDSVEADALEIGSFMADTTKCLATTPASPPASSSL